MMPTSSLISQTRRRRPRRRRRLRSFLLHREHLRCGDLHLFSLPRIMMYDMIGWLMLAIPFFLSLCVRTILIILLRRRRRRRRRLLKRLRWSIWRPTLPPAKHSSMSLTLCRSVWTTLKFAYSVREWIHLFPFLSNLWVYVFSFVYVAFQEGSKVHEAIAKPFLMRINSDKVEFVTAARSIEYEWSDIKSIKVNFSLLSLRRCSSSSCRLHNLAILL